MSQIIEFVLRQQGLDSWEFLIGDISDDNVLIRSHTERSVVDLRDLTKTSLEMTIGFILNTTVLDESSEVVLSVFSSGPAVFVDVSVKLEWPSRLQLVS